MASFILWRFPLTSPAGHEYLAWIVLLWRPDEDLQLSFSTIPMDGLSDHFSLGTRTILEANVHDVLIARLA